MVEMKAKTRRVCVYETHSIHYFVGSIGVLDQHALLVRSRYRIVSGSEQIKLHGVYVIDNWTGKTRYCHVTGTASVYLRVYCSE
jgi:hypothetical protein